VFSICSIRIPLLDLDSVASSIAYSCILADKNEGPVIALLQTQRADLSLRPENMYALQLAGLRNDCRELLCINDLPNLKPFPSNKFALVDHNRILPQFTVENSSRVVAVIDHHADEGLYKDYANPRAVIPSGSCASLVAQLHPDLKLPAELATLLLCAILIDTNGLIVGGKATQIDREAAANLIPRSTLARILPATFASLSERSELHKIPLIRQLADDLSTKKATLTELGTLDLLRRDYKEYMFTLPSGFIVKAGLSTVPRGLEACEDISRWSRRWMESKGLNVFGVLTTFGVDKAGKWKHCREMLWLVRAGKDVPEVSDLGFRACQEGEPERLDANELASRLWAGLEQSKELKLETHDRFNTDHDNWMRAYNQRNSNATRKVTAPLLKSILEGSLNSSA
jgi:exopolyphosphatase